MNEDDSTRLLREPHDDEHQRLPRAYYAYAVEWCVRETWTVSETANLLAGCVPRRRPLSGGSETASLDDEIATLENTIRSALGNGLRVVRHGRYFGDTTIERADILPWAEAADIRLPPLLKEAAAALRRRRRDEDTVYTTPLLTAAHWVVREYWRHAPPNPPRAQVLRALADRFPALTTLERDLVDQFTRTPDQD